MSDLTTEKVLLGAINAKSDRVFVPGELLFAAPQVISTPGAVRNTAVVVTPVEGMPFTGSQTINYNRLDLATAPDGDPATFLLEGQTNSHDLLDDLRTSFGVLIQDIDLVNEPLPAADQFGNVTVILKAAPTSHLWVGQLTVTLSPLPQDLSELVGTDLDGLTLADVQIA